MEKAIEVKNLEYSYPDGNIALVNINFTVNKGETIGIIGNTGSGKTTLLLNLNGILRGKGSIKITGVLLNNKNLKKIRKKFGIVFQRPDDQLFCPTVFDDVAFGPINSGLKENEVIERVNKALYLVKMEEYINRSSHHLSEGEKKKIAFATILSMDTSIMGFDEPTANLDPKSRHNIINLIKSLQGTKIIASHDINMIFKLCNKVILLKNGKMKFMGTTLDLKKNRSILKKNDLL